MTGSNKLKVAIAGHGFLATNLSRSLTQDGHHVRHVPRGAEDAIADVDVIYHLRGLVDVAACRERPLEAFNAHLVATVKCLEACRERRIPLVFASTDKVYGPCTVPASEAAPLVATGVYETTKAAADLLAQSWANTYEAPLAITRCANFYGLGDPNQQRLIPSVILAARNNAPLVLRGNPNNSREWLYIDDAVAAYRRLTEALLAKEIPPGACFNFGSGSVVSTLEIIRLVETITGKQLAVQFPANPAPEISAQCLDSSKASQVLQWQARYSLEAGLRKILADFPA